MKNIKHLSCHLELASQQQGISRCVFHASGSFCVSAVLLGVWDKDPRSWYLWLTLLIALCVSNKPSKSISGSWYLY